MLPVRSPIPEQHFAKKALDHVKISPAPDGIRALTDLSSRDFVFWHIETLYIFLRHRDRRGSASARSDFE
jgi:hypothetical protein